MITVTGAFMVLSTLVGVNAGASRRFASDGSLKPVGKGPSFAEDAIERFIVMGL